MKRFFALVIVALVSCATGIYAQENFRFLGSNSQLWSDSGNWENGKKPDNPQAVAFVQSSVVVDEDVSVKDLVYDASEVTVTVASGFKLTVNGLITPFEALNLSQCLIVEDSAQLLYGHPVQATVHMKSSPFYNKETAAWHFIASPLATSIAPASLDSLIPEQGNYELMRFNQSNVGNEWERYKDEAYQSSFQLENGQGYLYAVGSDVTVSFVGEVLPNDQPVNVSLVYNGASNVVGKGLNLVGNPFTCDAYSDRSFYKMNAAGTDVELVRASSNEPIPSCTGVMVHATATGQSVGFSRAPFYTDNGCVRLTLKSNGIVVDEAVLSFNQGDEIGKFYFNDHPAHLYFQRNGQSCAIASEATSCQTPVHFKTTSNGNFVLTVTPENANVTSLYLVDNMTGADINLLATSSYSFSALASDFVSRFKLFVNTDHGVDESHEDEGFAYYANGNIVMQGVEEGATLEVVDLMGRVVVRGEASSCVSTNSMAAGVYLLRLTKGNVVRTQKMVVW